MINFKNKALFSQDISQRVLTEVNELGYSLVENFLNEEEIAHFRLLVHEAVNDFDIKKNPYREKEKYHIHDLLLQNGDFLKLFEDPRLQQLVSLFLNDYWTLYAFTSSSVPPQGTNYARRVHNDCPRNIPNYITNMGVIWPLDDYTPTSGSLEVLSGSHIGKARLDEEEFNKNKKSIYCKAGDFIIFNARLVHRTDINSTDNFRHSLTMNACRHYMKPRFDWVRMLPSALCDSVNEQARRILGFHSRTPASLDEYFVSPEERLYKAGQE